mmetsp:Transcript_239/g.675  ORF Transcript_239/g.675 Transcript_239/m.675 type:complete len:192 (-) Transcript_239:122-697(-)
MVVYHARALLSAEECRGIVGELPPFEIPRGGDGERIDLGGIGPRDGLVAARRAMKAAAAVLRPCRAALERLADDSTRLICQAVVYGPDGAMAPHVDASVGRAAKFLAVLCLGASCVFRADSELIELRSADALVLDAANVLHGVERIIAGTSPLPELADARVSLMFWEQPPSRPREHDLPLDLGGLFDDSPS